MRKLISFTLITGCITFAGIGFMSGMALAAEPSQALQDTFKAVCDSAAVKSEKLTTACKAGEAPEVVKKGDRFKAVGIGAELNTLSANIAFFKKA